MKKFSMVFLIVFILSFFNALCQESEILYLSGRGSDATVDWQFMVSSGRRANEWTTIPVPSNWELQGFGAYNYGHDENKAGETGFYRHRFAVPDAWQGRRIFIVFEGVMTDAEVKINGQSAGPVHQGGFYRFDYEITNLIRFAEKNLLQVAVHKMSANESVNMAERRSDYWVFGGIYRPVYLKAVPQEFISWTAIDARASGKISIDVHLNGVESADRIEAQIVQRDETALGKPFSQKVAKGEKNVILTTKIGRHKNWSAETPNLYYLDLTLKNGSKIIHAVREIFGFRTIEVREGEGIFLNGERITLKGCDRHSFRPKTGRALSYNQCFDDVMLLKEMNMNAVRMSHYPPDTWFLDLCDEYGIYVLDELAGWQKPPYDTDVGRKLVKEMVKRDVNHPAILFWDNGNEGGWNRELDGEFGKYDPQNRRVLHPWEYHGGIDTDHYENYASVLNKLQSGNIYMPTEFLHGLYDGGLGAGLDDFWRVLWGHPLTGGMFLWVFADEGVVRTDRNGIIDTDGNHAPDGILGPFHEREASFYTIREIWSPVYIEENSGKFNGRIPVENRYDFTNLNRCRFEWKLVNYFDPQESALGNTEIHSGSFNGANIPARQKGFLHVNLPADWRTADAFILTAFDFVNRRLYSWKWKLKTNREITQRFIKTEGNCPAVKVTESTVDVFAKQFSFHFDKNKGILKSVGQGSHTFPFHHGPVFVAGDLQRKEIHAQIRIDKTENSRILRIIDHPYFQKLQWTIYGSGWLKLEYAYSYDGATDYLGISFDFPESKMKGMKWLGRGPYRVWKNRLKGQTVDVWFNNYKNTQRNTAWDYPEFAGYYADFNWVVLETEDHFVTIASDSEDLFMRVFSQADGVDPRHTKMIWPQGDISFLHAIPAIGTKFKAAEELGPQSQKFQASGRYEATLYFYFGLPGLSRVN